MPVSAFWDSATPKKRAAHPTLSNEASPAHTSSRLVPPARADLAGDLADSTSALRALVPSPRPMYTIAIEERQRRAFLVADFAHDRDDRS
jgi:hypothetical protein